MPTTRSGHTSSAAGATEKHKLETAAAPSAKSRKKNDAKEQKTIEDTINLESPEEEKNGRASDAKPKKQSPKGSPLEKQNRSSSTAEKPNGRNAKMPPSMLEKGIIYFFVRGRVDTDDPDSVDEIARTYFLLRPLSPDAKLGAGPIGDAGNSRLCILPKKVLPQSGRERFISWVEKSHASFQTLKDEFLGASEYMTKTKGQRHNPAAMPTGEGVYAITTTGRESHLAYMLTLPDKLGEVQKELGLRESGSFIISTRNPKYDPPSNVRLPGGPEYSKKIMDDFRDRRWMGTMPEHLDVPKTQFLLVGESAGIDKALQPADEDEKASDAEEPREELEMLKDEDAERMEHLGKDDSEAIFADLQVRARDYPKLKTTF